ncbi:MAG: WG repeat-containing protein [Cloacibacterium sp.]|nr:WG repeat-containing protein [Cloacibacterium sp.]
MKNIIYLLILFLISCSENSQKISRNEIYYIEKDKETGWFRVLNTKNKWGFIDKDSIIKIPFEYDFVNPFEHQLAYVKNKGKEFYINPKNEIVIEGRFDKIDIFSEGLASVKKDGKFGFINEKGKLIIPLIYDNVDYFRTSGLCAVTLNGKSGFIDKSGKEIIKIIYPEVHQEMFDRIVIVKNNRKWAFFDNHGNQLSDFIYDKVFRTDYYDFSKDIFTRDQSTFFKNGAALVLKNGKYEFLNEKIKPAFVNNKFDSASVFDAFKNAIVKRNGKYGMIKPNGEIKVPFEYDYIEPFDTNLPNFSEYYNARKGKIYSFFNKNLKKIGESYEPIYNNFSTDNPQISFKNLKGKYGVVDWQGNEKIPFVYDEALDFKRSKNSIAKKNGKFGVISYQNKEVFPFIYDEINELDEVENLKNTYLLSNKKEDKIVNINGKTFLSGYQMIHPIFYDHSKFIVKKYNKFGIADLQNKILLPIVFDEISDWVEYGPEDRHIVKRNGKYGMVEYKTFKEKIPAIYDFVFIARDKVFVGKGKKYGIIDLNNKIICPLIYDEIKPSFGYGFGISESRIFARKGKQYLEIDEKGKVLKEISQKLYKENTDRSFDQIPEPPKAPRIN